MVDMMNQIYSNAADPLKGRQLPIMYSSKQHGFFTISGNLATQFIQGSRLGDGFGDQGRRQASPTSAGSATARPPSPTSTRRWSFASTYRAPVVLEYRQQSMGDLDVSGHRARESSDLRGAGARFRHSVPAGRRQRLPCGLCRFAKWATLIRARAGLGTDAHRICHLSRRRTFNLGRSFSLSDRKRNSTPGRWAIR